MLDVRKLIMLRAVAEHGSIAAAARSLKYTRSAVSQQISTLEFETGVTLLERAGKRVVLSVAGERLVEHTERVLVELRAAEASLSDAQTDVVGTLRVGIPFHEGPRIMSRALTELRREHPQLDIRLQATSDEYAAAELLAGRLDLAIISRYGAARQPRNGIREWEVGHDVLRVCVPRGHPLARGENCTIEDLRDEPWVLAPETMLGRLASTLCMSAGFDPTVIASVPDVSTAFGLVGLGWGVTIAPEQLPDPEAAVCRLPIDGVDIERHSVLIARDGEQGLPRIAAAVAAVQSLGSADAAGRA